MINIIGKTFLEYQLEFLGRGGVKDIVLCLGYKGEQIKSHFGNGEEYGVNIKYSFEDKPLGTAGALKKAEDLLEDTFFTIYGDSYLFLDFSALISYFNRQNKLALMTVYENHDRYDKSNTVVAEHLVKKYSKQERTVDMTYIDYGANIFRKKTLEMVPKDQFYSLEDLLPRLIAMGELMAFEVKERFYEIGSREGLREFEEYIRGAN